LRAAGLKVEPFGKWFRHDTPDEEWLPEVGRKHWIVLKRDKMIGHRMIELDALLDARVKSFVLVSGQLKDADNAAIIIKALPRIVDMIVENDFPFIAKVYRDSTVELFRTKRIHVKGMQRKKRRK
jgi:hypothetical protein